MTATAASSGKLIDGFLEALGETLRSEAHMQADARAAMALLFAA